MYPNESILNPEWNRITS